MRVLAHFLFLLCSLSLLTACLSKKPLDLNLKTDDTTSFVYETSNTSETDVSVMGMDQKVLIEQSAKQQYDIMGTDESGNLEIKLTTKSMKMEQINPMMTMKFDSENPDENEPADMVAGMQNMIGKEFQMKMSPKGEVLDLTTEGGVFEGTFDNVPNGEALEAQMEGQFGVDAMRSSLAMLTGFYPDEPVKVGDTWTKIQTVTSGIQNKIETTYTLTERKGGVATITFVGKVQSDPDAEAIEMMGMQMSYDLAGTQSGTILVDEKTGWAKQTKGEQNMEGKMNMSGGQVGEMSADMSVSTRYTIERADMK
ncbi:MAG: DUF6263 family protein [Bacteroidota bacterium]